jgi:hypothetical protein
MRLIIAFLSLFLCISACKSSSVSLDDLSSEAENAVEEVLPPEDVAGCYDLRLLSTEDDCGLNITNPDNLSAWPTEAYPVLAFCLIQDGANVRYRDATACWDDPSKDDVYQFELFGSTFQYTDDVTTTFAEGGSDCQREVYRQYVGSMDENTTRYAFRHVYIWSDECQLDHANTCTILFTFSGNKNDGTHCGN